MEGIEGFDKYAFFWNSTRFYFDKKEEEMPVIAIPFGTTMHFIWLLLRNIIFCLWHKHIYIALQEQHISKKKKQEQYYRYLRI